SRAQQAQFEELCRDLAEVVQAQATARGLDLVLYDTTPTRPAPWSPCKVIPIPSEVGWSPHSIRRNTYGDTCRRDFTVPGVDITRELIADMNALAKKPAAG